MKFSKPIVFFDLETTGVNVNKSRIVEFAGIKINSSNEKSELHRLVNPLVEIPEEASEIHGIYDMDVADQPTFNNLSNEILDFIDGCALAGYNIIRFDVPLLKAEFDRVGAEWDFRKHDFLDMMTIFRRNFPMTLGGAVKYYLEKDIEDAHTALGDVESTIQVFDKQLEKYPDIPKTINELALYSNYDNEILDLGGKFKYNSEKKIVFTFGKYKDKLISKNIDYLKWMVNSDFANDTKNFIKKYIENRY